ncbi:MAG TPA: acyl carrier protein [Pseudonocardiaceae bacterium]|jgi:acyl carrier protein
MVAETAAVDGTTTEEALAELTRILTEILDGYGLDGVEITMTTVFHDDLELESVDLVTVGARLAERYGKQVNLAAYLAEKELTEVIGLQVGELADFVVASLRGSAGEQ